MIQRAISSILRIFFKLLYGQFSWAYDFIANLVSIGMWGDWVNSVLPEISGDTILELGHGPGHLQRSLARHGKRSIGLDLSQQMGNLTKKRLSKAGLEHRLINSNGINLPLSSNSIDQVVATFPTEYIFTSEAAAEIYRVLNRGGVFIIVPVAWIKPNNVIMWLASKLFQLTRQAGEWDDAFLEVFTNAGFHATTSRKELTNSTVLHIMGVKPMRNN